MADLMPGTASPRSRMPATTCTLTSPSAGALLYSSSWRTRPLPTGIDRPNVLVLNTRIPAADESDWAARANTMQMASSAPAFGRASLGLVALDSPAWALRRGLASLEGDLPAAIVRIDANATATEVRTASDLAASAGAAVAWIPEAAPAALAELLARACPDVVLDSALCGDELVERTARAGRACATSPICAPIRGAWRSLSAARARARSTGSTASTCWGGAPMRGGSRTGSRPASRCRSGSWATSPGSRACGCASERTSASCRRPRSRRARRWATRSISSPAGTSSCARCRARPPASAAPTLTTRFSSQRSSVTGLLSVPTPLTVMSTTSPSRR